MMIEEAYSNFCVERFSLPTNDKIVLVEKRIGLDLPKKYRQYLISFNGGYFSEPHIIPVGDTSPIDRLTFMNGIGASHISAEIARKEDLTLFDDNFPVKLLPIGYTIMGNLILLDIDQEAETEKIIYKGTTTSRYISQDIESFFSTLHVPLYD